MRTRRLIKYFSWEETDRPDVVLGTDTRINPDTNKAQLKADSNGDYPTVADLYVKSRLINPLAVRQWTGFMATILHKKDVTNQQVTGEGFRLNDGTTEYYWDGGAWSAAGASDWNTEAQVATNIAAFDATARKLQIVVNLSTTDKSQTPELVSVKVLYEAAIDFLEDMIYRSLVPLIRAQVRPVSQFVVAMPSTGTTLNVSDADLESGYKLVDVDSVFDHAADPDHLVDVLSSYDSGTGVITLTTSVAAGQQVWVRFLYEPVVAVTTSQDYVRAKTVPAIVLTDIASANAAPAPAGDDYVADKTTNDAVVVPSPVEGHLRMTLLGMADKGVDALRLLEEINAFFENNKSVSSTGIDEPYSMSVLDEYAAVGEPGQDEIHMGRATFQIWYFKQWLADAYDDKIVANFQLALSSS